MSASGAPFPPQPPIGHVTIMRASRHDFVGVFVEGPSDVAFWRRWLRWEPVSGKGKPGVLKAMADLAGANIDGCVGIVDADFDRLEGSPALSQDIVVSEGHDIECDLVRSAALDALVAEAGGQTALAVLAPSGTFRDALIERALPFGLLRWTFHARREAFPEGRLGPFVFVDKSSWLLRENDLLGEAARVLGVSRDDLDRDLRQRRSRVVDGWSVCNGHDVVALLAIALQACSSRAKFSNVDTVAMALRLGLDSQDRDELSTWRELGAWEARRSPYRVRR